MENSEFHFQRNKTGASLEVKQVNVGIMSDPSLLLYNAGFHDENEQVLKLRLFYEISPVCDEEVNENVEK